MRRGYVSAATCVAALGSAVALVAIGCEARDESGAVAASRESVISASGSVLTYHNDIARTGANLTETQVAATNVVPASFGRLFSMAVDGKVYAQPLYVPALAIAGGTHDVVIIATENNSVYAFDAVTGQNYWRRTLGVPVQSTDLFPAACTGIGPTVGITGTPVIDPATGLLYVVAATNPSANVWAQTLHAINLATGADAKSQLIGMNGQTLPSVTGDWPPPAPQPAMLPSSPAGQVPFDPRRANQRAGLLLVGGHVYVAWGAYCDDAVDQPNNQVFFGWVMSFDATTLARTAILNTDPRAEANPNPPNGWEPYGGSIWQSGAGLTSDGTNIYLSTGNGPFLPGVGDYGDSILKLGPSLAVLDSFTPFDQAVMNSLDLDLASSGVVLLPISVPGHPNLAIASGKEGAIYLLDRDHLGGAQPSTGDRICPEKVAATRRGSCLVDRLPATGGYDPANPTSWVPAVGTAANLPGPGAFFGVPAYYNGRVYFGGNGDNLKSFTIGAGGIAAGPVAAPALSLSYPGTEPVVSANGATDGNAIVWAVERVIGLSTSLPAVLHAYRADTLAELYTSHRPGVRAAEDPDLAPQFTSPTVASGRVYVPGETQVTVYGLFPVAKPVIPPASGTAFGPSTVVTISDATPGATIHYTLDGTQPTIISPVYTGGFVVRSSLTVKARAFLSATQPSEVAISMLAGSCNNSFPSCGAQGNACSTCDPLRSTSCSPSGQCVCGGTGALGNSLVCNPGSWCYQAFGFACATVPKSGSWFNPARSGWGLHVSTVSGSASIYVVWLTYDSSGGAIWYSGILPLQSGHFTGAFQSFRYVNGNAVGTDAGNMTLTTTSATTGSFSFNFTGQATRTEPIQFLAEGGSGSNPPLTGAWFAPSQAGWGQFFDVQGTVAIADVCLYDNAGNPTWLTGSVTSNASGFPAMDSGLITGFNLCPYCTGTPSLSEVAAGTISLSGLNASDTNGNLDVALTAPFTRFNNPALPIARLTN